MNYPNVFLESQMLEVLFACLYLSMIQLVLFNENTIISNMIIYMVNLTLGLPIIMLGFEPSTRTTCESSSLTIESLYLELFH